MKQHRGGTDWSHLLLSGSCCYELKADKEAVRSKHCPVCRLHSYPALFLLLLGILVLQAAHARHTGQTVEAGDALTRVLTSNTHVWWTRKVDVKRGKCAERCRQTHGDAEWIICKPFMLSGLFKAPCMTAWASSFLVRRASMVSRSSTSSES